MFQCLFTNVPFYTIFRKMKILWVNPSFLDYRIPVYKKLNELTNGQFYLIYSKQRVPARVIQKVEEAISLKNAIGLEHEKVIHIGRKGDYSNMGINIPCQMGLFKAINSVGADLIIGEGFFQWTPVAVFIAFFRRIPAVIAYEKTAHTERNCSRIRFLYRKFIGRFISGFSVNGKLTKEFLVSCGYKEKQIFIGGMSADSQGLSKQVKELSKENINIAKSKYQIHSKGISFLFVGRLIELKGVIYLLNAWTKHTKKYPEDHLFIVGDGILFEEFTVNFNDYSSIHFIGGVDYDQVFQYYSIADVFIIPTLEDNWSLVVPEAMACGLPIACSIYNGCYPELVHEGVNGKLFDPLEEKTLLHTLDYFHHIDINLFGKNSIEIEKEYSPDKAALRIYNMCQTIIKKNS